MADESTTPTPSNPATVTGTTSVFTTGTFWGVVIAALAGVWQAGGWNLDWLGRFNTTAPLILQALAGLGILTDHLASQPRKVSLKLPGTGNPPKVAYKLKGKGKYAAAVLAALLLIPLTGCPPIVPGTTQPSPVDAQLSAEQAQLNTVSIAVSLGYDAWTLYSATNPNPIDDALATKAFNAVQAAIATAQSHITAGDVVSAQNALADVQAAFLAFVTSTHKATVALHTEARDAKAFKLHQR